MAASTRGHTEVVKVLADAGADLNVLNEVIMFHSAILLYKLWCLS